MFNIKQWTRILTILQQTLFLLYSHRWNQLIEENRKSVQSLLHNQPGSGRTIQQIHSNTCSSYRRIDWLHTFTQCINKTNVTLESFLSKFTSKSKASQVLFKNEHNGNVVAKVICIQCQQSDKDCLLLLLMQFRIKVKQNTSDGLRHK